MKKYYIYYIYFYDFIREHKFRPSISWPTSLYLWVTKLLWLLVQFVILELHLIMHMHSMTVAESPSDSWLHFPEIFLRAPEIHLIFKKVSLFLSRYEFCVIRPSSKHASTNWVSVFQTKMVIVASNLLFICVKGIFCVGMTGWHIFINVSHTVWQNLAE